MSNVALASNAHLTGSISGLAIRPRSLREQAENNVHLAVEVRDLAQENLDRHAESDDDGFYAAVRTLRLAEEAVEGSRYELQLVLALSPEEQNAKRELVAASGK